MNMFTRRDLMRNAVLAPIGAAVALSGCSILQSTSVPAAVQTAAGYLAAIAKGVASIAPNLPAGLLPAAILAQIETWSATIGTAAIQVASATTAAAAATLTQTIEGTVNEIMAVLAGLPSGTLPATVQTIVAAINVALPFAEIVLGMITAPAAAAKTAAARRRFGATAPAMTPAQALAFLNSLPGA